MKKCRGAENAHADAMHADHSAFVFAIRAKRKVSLTWMNQRKGCIDTVVCWPLDWKPWKRHKQYERGPRRYLFWHEAGEHQLPPPLDAIQSIELLEESFDPGKLPCWPDNQWVIARDWPEYPKEAPGAAPDGNASASGGDVGTTSMLLQQLRLSVVASEVS
jgi:hypothetical protein